MVAKLSASSTGPKQRLAPPGPASKTHCPRNSEEEAFSSTKSCMYGCVIYLNHILDPFGCEGEKLEVTEAISQILDISKDMPEGYGLEMGHYWSWFMVGIAVFNDNVKEKLLRRKLNSSTSMSIYVSNSRQKL
jgi:hypothetical protein